ncbi:hypothetical protein AVMA1855_23260 [Acidovorax sp. SUPP1855]|uniref:hypothetical protein n=1 Tax=Acidovorax sp. SUPP1855 TaxID=431774 RepID=UPI0023DE504A|nr:hypothetical protein [Acidovorax sp. SUPP1855]GKS87126.1 hypothetical protein AVMA1855_23260 [Acidovorax sp. SUPP1855]
MIVNIDFSIFSAPTRACGNVTGELDVSHEIRIGDEVAVLSSGPVKGFTGRLKVISIICSEDGYKRISLALEDVVFESIEEVDILIRSLEKEGKLFFDSYY